MSRYAAASRSVVVAVVLSIWSVPAAAQSAAPNATSSAPFGSPIEEPIFYHVMLNQLEGRFGADNSFRWSGEAWAGTDTNRLWLKSEGTVNGSSVEDGQQEIFYDRPVTPFFDLQGGVRSDLDSRTGRTWAAFGVEGLAPYFFDVSATAYMSDGGHYAAKLDGSTDWLITQRLILQPQMEINLYTKDDPGRGIGAGFADLDTGLRLRYEFTRKFAPYLGVTYESKFGGTADFARRAGERTNDLRLTVGVRMWL